MTAERLGAPPAASAAGPALRARRHAALGDLHRLAIVDALRHTDRTPGELQTIAGLPSNLLAFHLDVLEDAGLITRRRSHGDRRRRYVTLRWASLDELATPAPGEVLPVQPSQPPDLVTDAASRAAPWGAGTGTAAVRGGSDGGWHDPVVFVCTRSAARSQLAAALWRHHTGGPAISAGSEPADAPDPLAMTVAEERGLRVDDWTPRGYDEVVEDPTLVVSVCDRARESGIPWAAPHLHWSIADPHGRQERHYRAALATIDDRVRRLVSALDGPMPRPVAGHRAADDAAVVSA